jgi:cytochrome c556
MRQPISLSLVVVLAIQGASILSLSACGDEKSKNPIEQAIKDRQGKFRKMGAIMKSLDEQTKAGDIDQKTVGAEIAELLTLAKQLPDWFSAGTGPESGFKTNAKPEVWADAANFQRRYQEFIVEVNKLPTVVDDAAALTSQYYTTGVACANCHKPFRVKND